MNAQTTKRMKILLADDGSQHAQAAVRLLLDLPLPPKSRVSVLRVFQPGQIDALRKMEQSLKHTEEQLLKGGIQAKSDLVLGYPAEMIVTTAQKMKPDLIVLGAKGLRAEFKLTTVNAAVDDGLMWCRGVECNDHGPLGRERLVQISTNEPAILPVWIK